MRKSGHADFSLAHEGWLSSPGDMALQSMQSMLQVYVRDVDIKFLGIPVWKPLGIPGRKIVILSSSI